MTMLTNTLNVGGGVQYPNRISSGKLDHSSINEWFDPSAFQAPVNLLNTPQFNNPNAQIGFAGVAKITSVGSPPLFQRTSREIQLALKLYF